MCGCQQFASAESRSGCVLDFNSSCAYVCVVHICCFIVCSTVHENLRVITVFLSLFLVIILKNTSFWHIVHKNDGNVI